MIVHLKYRGKVRFQSGKPDLLPEYRIIKIEDGFYVPCSDTEEAARVGDFITEPHIQYATRNPKISFITTI